MTIKEGTVTVVAPSTLNEGYTFAVDLNGESLMVKVPTGGVKEGQTFQAIIVDQSADPEIAVTPIAVMDEDLPPATSPSYSATVTSTASAPPEVAGGAAMASSVPPMATASIAGSTNVVTNKTIVHNPDGTQTVTETTTYPDGRVTKTVTTLAAGAAPGKGFATASVAPAGTPTTAQPPTGAWRYDIFACFDTCGNGMFWMSWCCTYIALGQLLQRLKMNVCGQQTGEYSNTCMIWTILWAVCYIIWWILTATTGYGTFLYLALGIIAIVALTQARYWVRTKWNIPADCCEGNGCLSDCCCVYWCTCCSIIQMMRHTHDEREHYYSCGSPTGLDVSAPEVV